MRHTFWMLIAGLTLGMMQNAAIWADPDPAANRQETAKAAELKGDLARIKGEYSVALLSYATALSTVHNSPVLYNKMGIAELKLEDHRLARKYFKTALKYDAANMPALNNLGAVDFLDRKYNAALRSFKQALALDEANASVHLNVAECWAAMGQMDHAMTEYSRALEIDPDILANSIDGTVAQVRTPEQFARAAYLIAKAYMRRGNLDGALDYLHRAKDAGFPKMSMVYTDQEFAPLWNDPRLAKIVKR